MEKEKIEINGQGLIADDLENVKKEEDTIVNKVKEMRTFLHGLKGKRGEIRDKIVDISDELGKNHPDSRETYLFHIMIYSNIPREKCTRFDFEGEDSIVKRLEALVKEYQIEDK